VSEQIIPSHNRCTNYLGCHRPRGFVGTQPGRGSGIRSLNEVLQRDQLGSFARQMDNGMLAIEASGAR